MRHDLEYTYSATSRTTLQKKVSNIPVPSRDVTYQTLPGLE
jgi:hypothetical protein